MSNLKKAFISIGCFIVVNALFSYMFYVSKGVSEFKGYVVGIVLNVIFSLIHIFGTEIGIRSRASILFFLIAIGGFMMRLFMLIFVSFGGYYILEFDMQYFVMAFMMGAVFGMSLEIWYAVKVNESMHKSKFRKDL